MNCHVFVCQFHYQHLRERNFFSIHFKKTATTKREWKKENGKRIFIKHVCKCQKRYPIKIALTGFYYS